MADKLGVFVCSYSGEWVDPSGSFSPSGAISAYMDRIAEVVQEWFNTHQYGDCYLVCNGGILIDGLTEGERVREALEARIPLSFRSRLCMVVQGRSWTTPTDLFMGMRALEHEFPGRYPAFLEDPRRWDIAVACGTAYARKTRNIVRYALAGRPVGVIHYPVGGSGFRLRLKQVVSQVQEVWSFATGRSFHAKNRKRAYQIKETPGLQPPELLAAYDFG